MSEVLCLRPEEDFTKLGVALPKALSIRFCAPDAVDLAERMRMADALVIPAVGPPLDATLFGSSAIRLVQVTGAGVDRVDGRALAKMGIAVANVPGGSDGAVAEYVLTAARWFLRGFAGATDAIIAGGYADFRARAIAAGLNELAGVTVGLVGHGRIGRAVAARCRAAGAAVIVSDPAEAGSTPLEAVFAMADVVSLHVPLTDATRGLVGADLIAAMKPSAILINAARGGIVDEAALAAALGAGRIAGAAVDVHDREPPVPDAPLLKLDPAARHRLLLTPHVAGVTRQSWAALFRAAWDNVEAVLLRGEPPRNVTN